MRNSLIDLMFKDANADCNGQPWHTHYPLTSGKNTAFCMPGFSFSENQVPVKLKMNTFSFY